VWLDKNISGVEADEEIVEMDDDATDEECEEACADALDQMIGSVLDTGWEELE
jgi:hypothetical protein